MSARTANLLTRTARQLVAIASAIGCFAVPPASAQSHAWTARQEARLRPSDVVPAFSSFHDTLSVSGDRCAIGWPMTNTPLGQFAGSVHVYRRSGGAWIEEARLTATDGHAEALFGRSVALDGGTLVIGAQQDLAQIPNAGAVYVFERVGSVWRQTAQLTAADAASGGSFGASVELQGDRLAVGATGHNAVYVFERDAGAWSQQARLAGPIGQMALAVALDGDTVVAGIPSYGASEMLPKLSGAVIVFRKNGASWSQEALILTPAPILGAQFGRSVAIDGDRIVAGAPFLNGPGGLSQGRAFTYKRTGTTWSYGGQMIAPDGAQTDDLGWSVAVRGDIVVAAAIGKRVDGVFSAGGMYVFEKPASNWTVTEQFAAASPVVGDQTGYALSFDGTSILAGTRVVNAGPGAYVFRIGWPSFCFGDGSLATPCPCAAPDTVPSPSGAPRSGCANSLDLRGARLAARGLVAPELLAFEAFVGPGSTSFGFLVKSDAHVAAGIADGDGVRCVDGGVVRFGEHDAGSNGDRPGAWTYPNDVQTALVSTATAQLAGATAFYQLCYRDPAAGFCSPRTFNWSNTVQANWP